MYEGRWTGGKGKSATLAERIAHARARCETLRDQMLAADRPGIRRTYASRLSGAERQLRKIEAEQI